MESLTFVGLCLVRQVISTNSLKPFEWKDRHRYYTPNVETKMNEILLDGCKGAYKVTEDNSYTIPSNDDLVFVSIHPIDQFYRDFWGNMSRPSQMRVSPELCKAVYTKRSPLFSNPTCQLPGYMHQSAPRCQTSYLKWACESASQDINDTTPRGFILPDADHAYVLNYNLDPPPEPWLLTARNSLVSRCGQIITKCGLVHTNANCNAMSQKPSSASFKRSCPLSQIHGKHTTLSLTSDDRNHHYYNNSTASDNKDGAMDVALRRPLLNSTCGRESSFGSIVEHYRRVFVVAEVDDTDITLLIQRYYPTDSEILPRIAYHLEFLKANPDIRILIGCDTKKKPHVTEAGLRHLKQSIAPMLQLLGLSMDRLVVHRNVFAEEVFLPMEGGCQDPVYNTWQILHMRKRFFDLLNISDDHEHGSSSSSSSHYSRSSRSSITTSSSSGSILISQQRRQIHPTNSTTTGSSSLSSTKKEPPLERRKKTLRDKRPPVMLLLKRSSNAKHTRNGHDLVRQWSDEFASSILGALTARFPQYEVKMLTDKDESTMGCHSCLIKKFNEASVLIGMHGAGLGNQIYMRPNSAVIELCPYQNDGRCMLGGGPFNRAAALMAHDYLVHQPPYDEYKWIKREAASEFDIDKFVTHIHSFMISTGRISADNNSTVLLVNNNPYY